MHKLFLAVVLFATAATDISAQQWTFTIPRDNPIIRNIAGGGSCKSVGSCEEAVELWCGGYSRADADHDGIPCENVCHSVEQVNEIRKRIGCGEQ